MIDELEYLRDRYIAILNKINDISDKFEFFKSTISDRQYSFQAQLIDKIEDLNEKIKELEKKVNELD